jgi:chromosome segregation ATPase
MSDLETTETVQAAPVDVNELRAEIQADKVLLADKERTLTAAELVQAEGTHAELLARCDEAQRSLDELEKKVSAQQSAFARAQSRVTNAREGVIVHRSNVPPRYGNGAAREAWREELARLESEEQNANAEYGKVVSALTIVQAERRAAVAALSDLSWQEGAARRKLDALTPPPARTRVACARGPADNFVTPR